MAAKTFRAPSIKEAIGQVKSALGSEAMILSTKKVPRGPQNPYGKDMFEITASDEAPATPSGAALLNSKERHASWVDSPPIQEGRSDWYGIQAELSEIKDILRVSNHGGGIPQLLDMHPACLNLYSKLLVSGISERNAWLLMDKVGGGRRMKTVDPEVAAKELVAALKGAINVSEPFSGKNSRCHVAAFVGPTGVGKTTTIAKLCAELSLKQKRKVGIISVDSYRIGAVDQLKTYAAIMGLPCLSAFNKEDLAQALQKMDSRDVILIDTAGQSHRDMQRLKELGGLLTEDLSIDTHLVLSATVKPEDMKEAAANFSILKPSSYVFTKVDETKTLGSIIDQMMDRNLPVSYITNGQRVPEDIFGATRRRVLKLVLGGEGGLGNK